MTSSAGEALDRLLGECVTYRQASVLHDYVDWQEAGGESDPFTRAGALAQHLVDLVSRREVDELPGFFAIAEELLCAGGEAEELVRVGLLESLQNICSHDDVAVSATDLEIVFGTSTARLWDEIATLWERAGRRERVVARATEQEYLAISDVNVRLFMRIHRRQLADHTLASASDVLRLEEHIADVTYTSRRSFRKALLTSALFGLAIALVAVWLLR